MWPILYQVMRLNVTHSCQSCDPYCNIMWALCFLFCFQLQQPYAPDDQQPYAPAPNTYAPDPSYAPDPYTAPGQHFQVVTVTPRPPSPKQERKFYQTYNLNGKPEQVTTVTIVCLLFLFIPDVPRYTLHTPPPPLPPFPPSNCPVCLFVLHDLFVICSLFYPLSIVLIVTFIVHCLLLIVHMMHWSGSMSNRDCVVN